MLMTEYDDLLDEARRKAEAYRSTAKKYIPRMFYALRRENANLTPQDARDRIEKDCVGIWLKRTVLEALPDEAKNPKKQESGRLGQKKRNSAAVTAAKNRVLINTEGKLIVDDAHAPGLINEQAAEAKTPASFAVEDHESIPELDPIKLGKSQIIRELILEDRVISQDRKIIELEKTLKRKDRRIIELEEILKEKGRIEIALLTENQRLTNQLELPSAIPPVIEFPIGYRPLQEHMARQYKLGAANIWITIKLDTSTGKVTSVILGKESDQATLPQSVSKEPKSPYDNGLEKCPSCRDLFAENIELKDALSKTTTLSRASENEQQELST
jgi:hypothetical protein